MNIETQGLGAGSYPEPPEQKEKDVNAKVYLTLELNYSVPENWNREEIIEDIKENLNNFDWYDQEIEEVEINV
jgi:hypothetical protein